MSVCNNDLSKLVEEDNYIFFYIGRHLDCAKMNELFPELYFNLEFIGMKLKKAGPADVIWDFKYYKKFIVGNIFELKNVEKYNSFLQFVELYGSWIHKGLDIVQLALQEDSSSYVYKCAQELAKKRSNSFPYVLFPLGPHNKKRIVPQIVNVKKDISCVCFTDSADFVLIGTYQPTIELWNLRSKFVERYYGEHKGCILMLKMNSTSDKFLSTSTDGTVRVWNLVKDALSDRSPSPRERQDNYSELFPTSNETFGEKSIKVLEHSGPVSWAAFPQASSSNIIATTSHKSKVTIWDGSTVSWSRKEAEATCCELCHNDLWVVVGGMNRVSIYTVNSGDLLHSLNWNVNFLYVIPENLGGGLLMVSDERVDVWGKIASKVQPSIVPSEISPTEKYICCALNYHIALGTNKNNVRVCHRHTGKTLARYSESRTDVELIDVGLTEGALITAFSDKTLFLWPLDDLALPVSSICWPLNALKGLEPLVARLTPGNSVQIYGGRNVLNIIPVEQEVLQLVLSVNGDMIAYINSQSKTIRIIKTNTKTIIDCNIDLEFPIKFYLFTHKEKAIVAAHNNDSVVYVWFEETNEVIELGIESRNCMFVEMVSNDELTLITVSHSFGVHIWDLETGTIERTLSLCKVPKAENFSISFDRKIIALCEVDRIQLIDINKSEIVEDISELVPIIYCTLSPNGKILAYVRSDNIMVIHNLYSKERNLYIFDKKNNIDLILAVSNSGIVCVASSEPTVAVYTNLGISYIVLHASSIVPSPHNSEIFAALDNSGELHILQVCNGGSDIV